MQECKAFRDAKDQLSSSKVLVHYNPTLPIKRVADALAYGIGAIISHAFSDGSQKPVAFASHILTQSERNYSQLEKEAQFLIFGIRKFTNISMAKGSNWLLTISHLLLSADQRKEFHPLL